MDAQVLTRNYQWAYRSRMYQLELEMSQADYIHYKAMPRGYSYAHYTRDIDKHEVLKPTATKLWQLAKQQGLNDWEGINFIIAFVQQLSYQQEVTCEMEWAKYPIETLVERGGDCEDTAILLAALLKKLGFGTILLNPPGHMAVGVACNNCTGSHIKYDGLQYYYIETTYPGWEVGDIPMQFNSQHCSVHHVLTKPDHQIRSGGIANIKSDTWGVVSCSRPDSRITTDKTPPTWEPDTVQSPKPDRYTDEANIVADADKDGLTFPSKMTLKVNGQTITAYTSGANSVKVIEDGNKVKIYTRGSSLLVLD